MKKNKKEKKQRLSLKRIISDNALMLGKVLKISPEYIATRTIHTLVNAGMNVAGVYFTKILYDRYETTGTVFTDILLLCGIYLALQVIQQLTGFFIWYIFDANSRHKLMYAIHEELYAKAASMDLARYDDSEFYNEFIWAMNTAESEAFGAVDRVFALIYHIISIVGIVGIIATIEVLAIPIIIGGVIIGIFFNRLAEKLHVKWQDETKPVDRRKEYSLRVFYLADYAKEIRMSKIADSVLSDFDDSLEEQARLHRKFLKKHFFASGGREFFDILMEVAIIVLLIWRLFGGSITIGGYAAASGAIWNIYYNMRNVVRSIQDFSLKSMFIEKYRTFMDYENKVVSGSKSLPSFESLKLNNVQFTYDGCEDETLHGIDLEIKRGEKIAIVGYNGAGKTTLIKLLMRLYDTTGGSIEYNGRDIRDYKLDEYRNNFGTIFQDYKVFAATVAENVLGDEYTEDKKQTVLDALHRATFDEKLKELPDGIHTNLTREFDENGVNLSGGEAQKIAIARAFARDCDVIIMDEPSSALDPISEYELNHSIKENAKDKTVIFISHRLSTTRMADRIYMFEDGRVAECGTHKELMKKNGKYAYMFNLQAEKYRK